MLFPFATTFGQQKTIHCLPDSVQLSLEFASFDKLTTKFLELLKFTSKTVYFKKLSQIVLPKTPIPQQKATVKK